MYAPPHRANAAAVPPPRPSRLAPPPRSSMPCSPRSVASAACWLRPKARARLPSSLDAEEDFIIRARGGALNRIVLKSAALAGFLVVLCLGAAAIADPLKIRIGMQTPPDKFLTMLAHRKD